MDSIDVSIVLVNWNTRQLLYDCIKSIYNTTDHICYEITVVDNASNDGSVEMLKLEFPDVKIIQNQINRGFAAANNQGIVASKGRYILLLNTDAVVLENSIQKVIAYADSHEKTAVVGCRVLNADMTLQPTCFRFPSLLNMLLSISYLYKLFPRNRFFGRERMSWWNRDDQRQVDVVTGCFMLVRSEAIEQIGLLDESFFMYAEETDWCYRFRQAGWEVRFTPESYIVHFGGRSSRKVPVEMLIQLRLSILKFMRKHQSWLTHKIACFLTIMFFVIRLPIWFFVNLFSHQSKNRAVVKLSAYRKGITQVFFHLLDISQRTDFL